MSLSFPVCQLSVLRISDMDLGKLSLVLDYPVQRIDRNIPLFHEELLSAWLNMSRAVSAPMYLP